MFCNSCGSKLDPNSVFCPECGAKTENYKEKQKFIKFSDKKKRVSDSGASSSSGTPVILTKEKLVTTVLWISLLGVCAAITFLFVWAVNYEGGVWVSSIFDKDIKKSLSLYDIIHSMYNGYDNFLPTIPSTLLAVLIYALLYSMPVLTIIMLMGILVSKSKTTWLTALSIMNIFSAVTLAVIVPITLKLVPHIVNIICSRVSIIRNDIGSISYPVPIIFAVLIIILVVVSYILLLSLLRRNENEKAV